MKSTKTLTTMTCDNCGIQLAEAPNTTRFGSAPFTGWYTLKKLGGSSRVDPTQGRESKEWDFCCESCVTTFTSNFKIRRVTPVSPIAETYYEQAKRDCADKMVAGLTGKLEVHCMNVNNKSDSQYPLCNKTVCPKVLEKFGCRCTDG